MGGEGSVYLQEIVVFLDATPASDRRLRVAARLAADQRTELSAVFVDDDDQPPESVGGPVFLGWGLGGQLVPGPEVIPRSALAVEAAEHRFRDCLNSFGVDGDWYYASRRDVSRLVGLAQAADLIVVGQTDPHSRSVPRWRPKEIVFESGRPALTVPYVGDPAPVGHRVLVAWNGSREVARALHDALPVLRDAQAVTVLTVHDREEDLRDARAAASRIVRHLGRHGISARADHALRNGNSTADVLLSAAMDVSADLIVAGGCYHSLLRDALMGGVGRQLLQTMTVPLLTSQ